MSQIRHSLDGTIISQKAVKHDFIGPSGRNQRKKLRSFTTFFMQNKPNLPEGKIDAKCVFTKDYENKSNWTLGENKPDSNPIKPNFLKAQMIVNSLITKDYRKKDDFAVRKNKANSNPISVKPKMNVNLYVIEDYENEPRIRTPENKPNSNPMSKQLQSHELSGMLIH